MFTQCPECGSVFRVTADTLKVAAGLVRCGVCQHRFDALAALTDDPNAPVVEDTAPAGADAPPPFDDTITVEELGTGEVIELGAANDDEVEAIEQEAAALADDLAAAENVAADAEAREVAAEWLPENATTVATDGIEGSASVDDATGIDDIEASADAIEVNDSSVTGLEAIVLAGDESPVAEPGESTEADEQQAERAVGDLPVADDDRGAGAAPDAPSTTSPGDDLEFHGSEADLERVFIATGVPVVAEPAAEHAATALDEAAAATSIETLLPELMEVRDLPELSNDDDIDIDVAPQPVAPVATDANADDGPMPPSASRPDLDRTDEFPILVLDERDEAQAHVLDSDDVPVEDVDEALDEDDDDRDDRESEDRDEEDDEEEEESTSSAAAPDALGATGATPLAAVLRQRARAPDDAAADDSPAPRLAIPEHLRRGVVAEEDAQDADLRFGLEDETPRWWERRSAWVAGSVLLALALLAQVVHYNHEALARHATLGPWVLRVYTLIGLPTPIPSDLGAMELHQWGAATDARAAGRLRLRASVVNRAPFAQPYPVLRVTLHDRFGNVLGSRDVGARDYLPGSSPQRRLLATGQRLDAEIVVVDPGADAVGYEIDLCEEGRDGVRCQDSARSSS